MTSAIDIDLDTPADAAHDALTEALLRLWQNVLEVPALGLDDDFFDLGGHSLMALELRTHVRGLLHAPRLRVDPLRTPTVRLMRDAILAELVGASAGADA